MKRILINSALVAAIIFGAFSSDAIAQRRHRECREQYNAAVRVARLLRGRERRIQVIRARREFNECRRRARRF